jgi:hypothetical protein
MPVALTVERRGPLASFPSLDLFEFARRVESGYAKYGTTKSLSAYKGDLVRQIAAMVAEDKVTNDLFDKTSQPVLDMATKLSDDPDAAEKWGKGMFVIKHHVLEYIRRMRGKDVVSMVMGQLSKAERAKANSTSTGLRGQLSSVVSANAKKRKTGGTSAEPTPAAQDDASAEEDYADARLLIEEVAAAMDAVDDEDEDSL